MKNTVPSVIRGFLSALTCLFWSYCAFFIFTSDELYISRFSLVIGVTVWLILILIEFKNSEKFSKLSFITTSVAALIIISISVISFKNTSENIIDGGETAIENHKNSYFTERIVGMHFIYHTRYCIYDGWRQPKLDPIFTICLNVFKYKAPLDNLTLAQRLQLYRKIYPDRQYKFDCACARAYSDQYHNSTLWK